MHFSHLGTKSKQHMRLAKVTLFGVGHVCGYYLKKGGQSNNTEAQIAFFLHVTNLGWT